MKKLLCLCLALSLLLSACTVSSEQHSNRKVEFYYRCTDDAHFSPTGIMASETRILHWEQQSIEELMKLYLLGNTSSGLIDPFPAGMALINVKQSDDALTLTFDPSLASLTGIRLRVAASCIAQTLFAFGGYPSVTLCARTEQGETVKLDGQESIVVFPEKLVPVDYSVGMQGMPVRLYFADSQGRYLTPEIHSVSMDKANDLPNQLINALIAGPVASSSRATIPNGAMSLRAYIADDVCVVDFTSEFLDAFPKEELPARMAVFSVVATLSQLDHVDSVRILVEGKSISTNDSPLFAQELVLDERMVKPSEMRSGAYDATLYVCQEGRDEPVPFPLQIAQPIDGNLAQALCHALVSFAPCNGFYSPLENLGEPKCEQQDGIVMVTVPPELTDKCADDQAGAMLLECLSDTIGGLPGVQEVRFVAEGRTAPQQK